MSFQPKLFLVAVVFLALLVALTEASPVRAKKAEDVAVERIIKRLISSPELPQTATEVREGKTISSNNILSRHRRGRPYPNVALINIDSLRRKYEREQKRKRNRERNEENQKYFDTIG